MASGRQYVAFNLGQALVTQGDVAGGVWAYRGAVGCADPEYSPVAALELAKVLAQRGDNAGAIVAYEQVFRFEVPDLCADAAIRLGNLHDRQGDFDAALSAYRRGLEFTDAPIQPLCAINVAKALAQRGDHTGAVEMYRLAMETPHGNAAALSAFYFGECLVELDDLTGATAAFERSIRCRHHEYSAKAALALGALMENQGNPSGAEEAYRQVLDFGDAELADDAHGRLKRLATDADPRSAVREAIIGWCRTHYQDPDDPAAVPMHNVLARLLSEYREVKVILSHDLSKTGQALLRVTWLNEFHSFQLSADQARQLGIAPDTFTMRGTGGEPCPHTRTLPHEVTIDRLRINDGAPIHSDDDITVEVQCDPNAPMSWDTRLRIGFVLEGIVVILWRPIQNCRRTGSSAE